MLLHALFYDSPSISCGHYSLCLHIFPNNRIIFSMLV